ncbi:MAG TPA: SHOCT domain-containing protein [Bacteroidales bacterium]|nr:SHOCT domain-containing protein [Bacteroidales bacterium]
MINIIMNQSGTYNLDMVWAWVLGLAIVVVIIFVIFRKPSRSKGHGPDGESTLDVLKDRYRRGEITQSEFNSEKGKYLEPPLHKDPTAIEHTTSSKNGIPGEPDGSEDLGNKTTL